MSSICFNYLFREYNLAFKFDFIKIPRSIASFFTLKDEKIVFLFSTEKEVAAPDNRSHLPDLNQEFNNYFQFIF